MSGRTGNAYETPRVTSYGTLRDLTSSEAMFGVLPLAQGALTLSPAMMPGGGQGPGGGSGPGGEVLGGGPEGPGGTGPSGGELPGGVEVLSGGPENPSGSENPVGGENPGGGEGAGGGVEAATVAAPGEAAGQEGGSLPFTGFAAGAVSVVGGALTATGVALRRITSRRR